MKSAIAIAIGSDAIVSQHLGDLDTCESLGAFERTCSELPALYALAPEEVVCDLHPDYASTAHANRMGLPILRVQHHEAHVLACMAENELRGDVLGIAWDGTGYGRDGALWGGEFFRVTGSSIERIGHMRPFRLPGGEAAVREPRRAAIGLLSEIMSSSQRTQWANYACVSSFTPSQRDILTTAIERGINSPYTTGMGRLFDAVAAILGIRQISTYEGQAALELEAICDPGERGIYRMDWLPMAGNENGFVVDWSPMVRKILEELTRSIPVSIIAARFHNSLAETIVTAAHHAGHTRIALSGGCFLNRRLMETADRRLRDEGFMPYWHQRIPPGDGCIALGQLAMSARRRVKG